VSGPQTNRTPDHGKSDQTECDAILEQVDAYALGALDRVDSGIVEQHLRWCPQCRNDVEAVRRAVDLLPLAAPVVDPPSPAVKNRLFARVASDNRSDPYEPTGLLRREERDAALVSSTTQHGRYVSDGPGRAGLAASSWLRFAPPAIIAPLAIVLVVVGAWANSMRLEIEDRDRVQAISYQEELSQIVANGGNVQLYSMEPQCPDCTGRGRLGVDVADSMGVVVAWDLDPERDHELWCVDKKGDKSMVSKLDVDAAGGAMQAFAFPDENMSDYTEVYIAQTNGEAMYMSNLAPQASKDPSATPDI